ncbi:hypothetical protein [Mucilaginibacter gotjawali]|uniref:Uncharacterized protein n=1 Tax=Mucilaginibacter gotjawali TaxID=1550579 RepID=A0A839SBG0_9SPHI|nr:hypothetical protein [Mucilaginibacter gotjawali]MBB3054593.1 hypothetical protein [Mucilaginibacter gotjawali]
MNKKAKYKDIFVLLILFIFLVISIFRHFSDGYILTVNLYLGFICLFITTLLRIKDGKRAKVFLICLLMLAAFNIISFTVENISFGKSAIYNVGIFYFSSPGINPLFLLMLVIYSIIDYGFSIKFYKNVFGKSDKEANEEYKKMAEFYYKRFSSCTREELDFALKNINEYPHAGQESLKIVVEKSNEEK